MIDECETPRVGTSQPMLPGAARSHLSEAGPDAGEITENRIISLLPAQLLQPGEVIILLIKPSLWYVLLEPLRFFAGLAILVFAGVLLSDYGIVDWTRRDLILAGLALAFMRIAWQFMEWLSRVYVLTDRRVIRVKGVLRVLVFEAQLKQIQHTNLSFSIRERLFGLGSVVFATAGTGEPEASWVMLAKPLEVHQVVVQTMNRYR